MSEGKNDMKLSDMKQDSSGKISAISGDEHFMRRITSVGLTTGTPFLLVRNDRKMPVLIYCRETLLAVNRNDAGRIEIENE